MYHVAMLSQRHPMLYRVAVAGHRAKRHVVSSFRQVRFAKRIEFEPLPYRLFRHTSLLLRRLGDADMRLQHNKIKNLRIAAKRINGILIRPGEMFSFWKLTGKPSARKGYVEGMLLKNGDVKAGVGGGLCQLANLLHWMTLHSPMNVTERFHHSFDAFPDSGRVLPFGSGATIFYNYVDLQFKNSTPYTFQMLVWLTKDHLCGEIRSDREYPLRYHVFERDHAFIYHMNERAYYRSNAICRETRKLKTGKITRGETLYENYSRMKYAPPKGAKVKRVRK